MSSAASNSSPLPCFIHMLSQEHCSGFPDSSLKHNVHASIQAYKAIIYIFLHIHTLLNHFYKYEYVVVWETLSNRVKFWKITEKGFFLPYAVLWYFCVRIKRCILWQYVYLICFITYSLRFLLVKVLKNIRSQKYGGRCLAQSNICTQNFFKLVDNHWTCQSKVDIILINSICKQIPAIKISAMLLHHHVLIKTEESTYKTLL